MAVEISYGGQVSIPGSSQVTVTPTFTPITATGGSITDVTVDNVTYRVHTFTGIGTFEVTSAVNNIATVEYLVVAGGGGGGGGRNGNPYFWNGGGGGAGGFLTGTLNLNVGSYDIDIGASGSGGISPGIIGESATPGGSGQPSKISFSGGSSIIESFGGGGGGGGVSQGSSGGSGGGGSGGAAQGFGTLGQGNPGGSGIANNGNFRTFFGGGGGGAGAAGEYGGTTDVNFGPQKGGDGLESFILGYPRFYAGGGGGGNYGVGGIGGGGSGGVPGGNATQSTGSGGGGSTYSGNGGNGSSGIVIIRYRIS